MGQLEAAMLTIGTVLVVLAVVLGAFGVSRDSSALEGIALICAFGGTISVVTSSYVRR